MKGWRTITTFLLAAVTYLLGWERITEVLDPQWVAVITAIAGIGFRLITNTPVGKISSDEGTSS